MLAISFAAAIFLGALLLMLPVCTASGRISFIDALFTSTSAICVTGLIVVDTATYFTTVGQCVIVLLIQLGGLGIMTFSTMVLLAAGRPIAISDRIMVQEGYHPGSPRDFKALIRNVFLLTVGIEGAGFVLLSLRFLRDEPWPRALFSGLFHSVSAFCNAGFSVYSDNLMGFRGDVLVNLTVAGLIIFGGLGFLVVGESGRAAAGLLKRTKPRLSLHSKLVLTTTSALIAGSFVIFLALENNGALGGLPLKEKILASFFQVVTPRTAGFNTIDIGALPVPSLLILIGLMFIGGSPGSCAGGIKTTTTAVWLAQVFTRLSGREHLTLLGRRVPPDVVRRAALVLGVAALWNGLGVMVLSISEGGRPGVRLEQIIFEQISAFGTVGLSANFTPSLTVVGKLWIIATMFVGRLGPLTVAFAALARPKAPFEYPQERVMIG